MPRGRKPLPTARKKLTGNPGHRPMNPKEPIFPAPSTTMVVTPPEEIADDPRAVAEWRRLAPMLRDARAITEADRASLIALCQQWSRYLFATTSVAAAGMVIRSPSGYPMPNPYISIANKALNHCTKLWGELGLTPSSRARVMTEGPPPGGDAFSEFDTPPVLGPVVKH